MEDQKPEFGIYGDDGNLIPWDDAVKLGGDFAASHVRGNAKAMELLGETPEGRLDISSMMGLFQPAAEVADAEPSDGNDPGAMADAGQTDDGRRIAPGAAAIQAYSSVFTLDDSRRDLLAAETDEPTKERVRGLAEKISQSRGTDISDELKRIAVGSYYNRVGGLGMTPGQCYYQADSLARHYEDGDDYLQAYETIARRMNADDGGWKDTAKASGFRLAQEIHGTAAGVIRLAASVDAALGGTTREQFDAWSREQAETSRWLRQKYEEFSRRGASDSETPFIARLNTASGWSDMAKFLVENVPSDILHRSEMLLGAAGPMLMFAGAEFNEEMQLRDEHPGRADWAIMANASFNASVDTILDSYMFRALTGPMRNLAYRFGVRHAGKAILSEAAAGAATNATEEGLGQAVQDVADLLFAAVSGEKDERTKAQILKDISASAGMAAIAGAASGSFESVGLGVSSQPRRYETARRVTDSAVATISRLSGKDVVSDSDALQIGIARLVVKASEQGDLDGVLQYGRSMEALSGQLRFLEQKRKFDAQRVQLQIDEYSENPELEGNEADVPSSPSDAQVVSSMLSDDAISELRAANAELAAVQYSAGKELSHADYDGVVNGISETMRELGADGEVEVDSGVTWENMRHRASAEALGYDSGHLPRAMEIGGRLWINSDRVSADEAKALVMKWTASRNLQRIAPDAAMADFYDSAAETSEMRRASIEANGKEEAETQKEKAAAARALIVSRTPAVGQQMPGIIARGIQAVRQSMRSDSGLAGLLASDREIQTMLSRALHAGGNQWNVIGFLHGQSAKSWDAIQAIAEHSGIRWRVASDEEIASTREKVAAQKGVPVEQAGSVNGWFDGASGEIVVSPGADLAWAFGHEAWHWFTQNRPDVLEELRGIVDEAWTAAQMDDFVSGGEGQAYSGVEADVRDEVYANRLGDLIGNPVAMERFSRELERRRAGAGRRFLMAVQDFLRSVMQALSGRARGDVERAASEVGKLLADIDAQEDAAGMGSQEGTVDEGVRYSIVEKGDLLDRLNSEKTIKVYRAMQLIDGKLYPPMAAKVNGKLVKPIELGKWEQADERPELAKNGKFKLDKANGSAITAAYNPYFHTSRSPLNDQFSSAYKRPNLVTVEVEVPESELSSGYRAEGAKDAVGEMTWHSGPVSSKLSAGKERKVILTRYDKPVRIVPDSEVAERIAEMLEGENVAVPENVVTPSLRSELDKRGVAFDNAGGAQKYSIGTRPDGRKYVKVDIDQHLFDGLSQKECLHLARKVIIDRFKGKIIGNPPDNAYVNKGTAEEYSYPASARRISDDIAEAKGRASTELDELMKAATFLDHTEDDGRHPDAKGGWDHYSVEFEFSPDNVYRGMISVKITGKGRVFHDMTQIEKAPASVSESSRLLNRDLGDNIQQDQKFSITPKQDAEYMEAVKNGDMERAQEMVNQAAKAAGYSPDDSWRMEHRAPNKAAGDVSLADLRESGLVPSDYFEHPEWYTSSDEEKESFYVIKHALDLQEKRMADGNTRPVGIRVYRGVDKTRNRHESGMRNGDWVTPSKNYAVNEGRMNPEGYRIISQYALLRELYWDGNSIAELGYDDGENYAYKDTANNIKLLDPVTYDDNGDVIPLSKRFKTRNFDPRYSLSNLYTDTTAFRKWFGNSKVVDEDGEPLVVYHGTEYGWFSSFDKSMSRSEPGIWFTSSRSLADEYAEDYENRGKQAEESKVYDCYVRIERPYVIDANGRTYVELEDELYEAAHNDKYDGIIVHNVIDNRWSDSKIGPVDTFMVKDGLQVKSATDNNGDYSLEDPDIRYSISNLYTGTAADYDRPSLHYVGTGEGQQVYGWGLYASTERGVAESYAQIADHSKDSDILIGFFDSGQEDGLSARESFARLKKRAANSAAHMHAFEFISPYIDSISSRDDLLDILRRKGYIYSQTFFTDRPEGDESRLLDWYGPVSGEQFSWIAEQALAEGWTVDNQGGGMALVPPEDIRFSNATVFIPKRQGVKRGMDVYMAISTAIKSPKAASEFLARAGIDGVKYPVGSFNGPVRNGDEVGWNYVSFRDDNIRVDHKWVDGDQKFSITSSVERTPDLVALHNLTAQNLVSAGELGGFPMPSIAVVRDSMEHADYGDVTLLVRPGAIDPKANRRNKIYSGDAWTPTFPEVEIEANMETEKKIFRKYDELRRKFGPDAVHPMYSYAMMLQDRLNSLGGINGIVETESGNTEMMKVFLLDKGIKLPDPVEKTTRERLSDIEISTYEKVISKMGRDAFRDILEGRVRFSEWLSSHGDDFKKAYVDVIKEETGNDVSGVFDKRALSHSALSVYRYLKNGPETVTTEIDYAKTKSAIEDATDKEAYRKWISDLLAGAEKSRGIYNGKDRFTRSGNRRPFSAVHDPVTLANVVKAMLKVQPEKGGIFGKNPYAVATDQYRSLRDVIADEPRLQWLGDEELGELKSAAVKGLQDVASAITERSAKRIGDTEVGSWMNTVDALLDAYIDGKGVQEKVRSEMNRGGFYDATDGEIADFCRAMKEIRNIPTKYFEAKPQRAVMFDEMAAAIVPDDLPPDAADVLARNGVKTYEYRSGDKTDRVRAVNLAADEIGGLRFSISEGASQDPSASRRIDDYYTAAQQVQIVQMLVPFVQRNLCGRAQEARQYLEAMGVDVARDSDAAYFAEMARQSIAAEDAGVAARRLEAAKKYGVVSKDLRREAVKLLVPMARDGKSLADAVEFLKGQGIAVTDANAKRLYDDAMKQAAPKAISRRRQAVRDWLYDGSPFYRILEKAGAYGKIVPSDRFRGQQFSGSFIDPAWVRYSGKSFKNVSDSDISQKLSQSYRDHSAFASDALARMYVEEFGGDKETAEEEMLEFFNGKTWSSLEEEMLDEEKSQAAEWRALEEEEYQKWLSAAMPEARRHVDENRPLTREMIDEDPDMARLVYELYSGIQEEPLSHGFREVSDTWIEGFNYAVLHGMKTRVGDFADAYEHVTANPVFGDSRPAPARAFEIVSRNIRAEDAERERNRANAMLEDAKAKLAEERRLRLSEARDFRVRLKQASTPGYTDDQMRSLVRSASGVVAGMSPAASGKILDEIAGIRDYPREEQQNRIASILDEIDYESARQAVSGIKDRLLEATKRWHTRTTRKGIPVGFAADGQRTIDRIADILRMGDDAAMNAILETTLAVQKMDADGSESASLFGKTMSRGELEKELHLLQTFSFLPGTTPEGASQAKSEFNSILKDGRGEFERLQRERMDRIQKAGAEVKRGLNGTLNVTAPGVKDAYSGERASNRFLLAQADPLSLFYMASGDDVGNFDSSWLGRQWAGIERATYGENARNVRDARSFSDAVSTVIGSRKKSDYAKFFADAAEERDTGAVLRVYRSPKGNEKNDTDYVELGKRSTIRRLVSVEDARKLLAEYEQTGSATVRYHEGDLAIDDINAAFLRKQIADIDARIDVDYQPFSDEQTNAAFLEQLKAARESGKVMLLVPHPKETWTVTSLVLSKGQALQAILTWDQPDAQAIMRWNGWTGESIEKLKAYCGDGILRLGDWMRQALADGRQELDDVVYGQFGARMPSVENYFPTRYARATRGGNDIRLGDGTPKSLETGFLAQRRFHLRPLDLSADAFQVFNSAREDQAHYIEFAPVMAELKSVLLQADVKDAIVNRYSREFLDELQDRLRVIEGGGRNGESVRLVSTLMRGFINKSLAFNVVSGVKQMLSTVAYANRTTASEFISAMSRIGSREYFDFVRDATASEYMESRAKGGFSADIKWLQEHAADGPLGAKARWLSGAAFSPITFGDRFSSLVGGYAVYRSSLESALKAGVPDAEAKAKALRAWQTATDQTQQGSYMKDLNRLQTSSGPARLLTMFLSNPIQIMNLEFREALVAAEEYRSGKKSKAARRILRQAVINHLLVPSAMLFVSDMVRSGFDIPDWWDDADLAEYIAAWMLGPFEGFAVFGQAISAAATALSGKGRWGKGDSPTDLLKGAFDNVPELADGELSSGDADAVCDILLAAGATLSVFNPALGDAVADIGTIGSAAVRQGRRAAKAAGAGKKKQNLAAEIRKR